MKNKKTVYLDYNSTSRLHPEVKQAVSDALNITANPSSVHSFGRQGKAAVEKARDEVSKMLNAGNSKVIFTSSGTEANNLALRGLKVDNVIVSAIEHPSVLKTATKIDATILPVDASGVVDLKSLKKILTASSGKTLVSVMMANNETGIIQPIKEIVDIVLEHGGFVHCDASQACGKINVDFQDLNVDMLTVCPHKFGGPIGSSALVIKAGLEIHPQEFGGGQESSLRAGTENVPAIIGFGKAAELSKDIITSYKKQAEIRDYIESEINKVSPGSALLIGDENRIPNTASIYLKGMKAETQVINFDIEGVAVSAGSACSSGKVSTSHVLSAMGMDKDVAESTIRVSVGPETTKQEAEYFVEVWKKLFDRVNNENNNFKKVA